MKRIIMFFTAALLSATSLYSANNVVSYGNSELKVLSGIDGNSIDYYDILRINDVSQGKFENVITGDVDGDGMEEVVFSIGNDVYQWKNFARYYTSGFSDDSKFHLKKVDMTGDTRAVLKRIRIGNFIGDSKKRSCRYL